MSFLDILRQPFVKYRLYKLNHIVVSLFTKKYVSHLYKELFGKKLNIDNPNDYNEWIQYAKFNSDTSRWAELSDKYLVRGYIKELGLSELLVNFYGVWDKSKKIDFDLLPKSFILKTNNGSGTNLLVRDKSQLDKKETRLLLDKWLKTTYGYRFAELHYLDIKPQIIAEELLDCSKQSIRTNSLIDYKFFCANGEPLCVLAIWDREKDAFKCAVYDLEWNILPGKIHYNSHYIEPDKLLPAPISLEYMISAVRKLSGKFLEVRVDLYEVDGKPFFGEMTFTSAGGFMDYFTEDFLIELGMNVRK